MKIIKISVVVVALAMLSFGVPSSSKTISELASSALSWKSDSIDVGEIPQGIPKVINYEFTNNADNAVLIKSVQGSCGCTATEYTKEAIEPGKTGIIKATYNAANKGAFTKTVTVTTSAEATPKVLTLKGIVIEKVVTN